MRSGWADYLFKHDFPAFEYHESECAPDLVEKFLSGAEILPASLIKQIRQLQDLMGIKGKQVQHEKGER